MRQIAFALALLLLCTPAFSQAVVYNPEDDECLNKPADPKPGERSLPDRRQKNPLADCRGSFEASFYIGGAVDTFAGAETLNYLNPSDTGKSTLREVAGFDFAYRLYGSRRRLTLDPAIDPKSGEPLRDENGRLLYDEDNNPTTPNRALRFPMRSQLWVYGETVHGVRSKEVECREEGGAATGNNNLPVCAQPQEGTAPPNTQKLLAIIKGATSLEAYVGLRWEVAPFSYLLQQSELDRARFYVKLQAGVINVAGGGDSADQHQIGIGALAVSGPLEGSYLEFGYGRNDLMVKNHTGRWKVDGFLSAHPDSVPILNRISDGRIRPFAQLTIDADFAGGADSLQTYFGLDYTFGGTK